MRSVRIEIHADVFLRSSFIRGKSKIMAVNRDKPNRWKADISKSVDMYNDWFMKFAPEAFRNTRSQTTKDVEAALKATSNITNIRPVVIRTHPEILPTLRMSTCPPLAVDRLIGLAGVPVYLVKCIEIEKKLPSRMTTAEIDRGLGKIARIIEKMADPDIFVWIGRKESATEIETHRAATIIADRLCGAVANPIIRNAQEKRQLSAIKTWLEARGYKQILPGEGTRFNAMPPGSFSFRMNVPAKLEGGIRLVNIPIDAVVMPKTVKSTQLPILIEAKSAGDFTNTNKQRKEEAAKMAQLRNTYGNKVRYNLFLCGYFDSGYLGYEAAEGIDWIWEHRISDLALLGV
jgi:type II restriction enzyme